MLNRCGPVHEGSRGRRVEGTGGKLGPYGTEPAGGSAGGNRGAAEDGTTADHGLLDYRVNLRVDTRNVSISAVAWANIECRMRVVLMATTIRDHTRSRDYLANVVDRRWRQVLVRAEFPRDNARSGKNTR